MLTLKSLRASSNLTNELTIVPPARPTSPPPPLKKYTEETKIQLIEKADEGLLGWLITMTLFDR